MAELGIVWLLMIRADVGSKDYLLPRTPPAFTSEEMCRSFVVKREDDFACMPATIYKFVVR